MLFNRLAKGVVRHYKVLIVLWIVLLIGSLPFAFQAQDAVVYDETSGTEKLDLPSMHAQNFIKDNFPDTTTTGMVIIVLTGPNVADDTTKELVNEINMALILASPSHDGELNNNVTVASLYSTLTTYTAGFLYELNGQYYQVYDELNQTRYFLYSVPLGYQGLYNQTEAMQFLLYGIPDLHLQVWSSINATYPGINATDVDPLAYSAASEQLDIALQAMGADAQTTLFARTYYATYTAAWNATSLDPNIVNDPVKRRNAALPFGFTAFQTTPLYGMLPAEQKAFVTIVFGSFGPSDWSDFHQRNAFCYSIFNQQMEQMVKSLPEQMGAMAITYFDLFYQGWNASSSAPNEVEFRQITAQSVEALASLLPPEQGYVVQAAFDAQPWEMRDDPTTLLPVTTNILAVGTMAEPWLVSSVAELGRNASQISIALLAIDVVQNQTLATYPIPIIPALVSGYVNTPTNDTMLITLTFKDPKGQAVSASRDITTVRDILAPIISTHPKMHSYVTGGDAISLDIEDSVNADVSRIDPFTIVLVLVLIGLFFRSFVASAVPPAVIGVGLGLAFAAVFFLGTYVLSINYTVLTLMMTSMLGAGCDYCIFILSRYREERHNGRSKEQAVEISVTWAGEAIATSGLTVIIGFGALSLGTLDVMKSMSVLAIGITCALLLALTLLPSFLMLLGDRMFWPNKLSKPKERKEGGYFDRSAKIAIKYAKAILVIAILISIPTTYLVFTLETSYDYIESMPDSESKQGILVMSDGFGGGKITPTEVALNMAVQLWNETGVWSNDDLDQVEGLCVDLASLDNVKQVISPTRPYGETIDYANISGNQSIEAILYDQYMRTMVGENNTVVLITVTFMDEPFSTTSIHSIDVIRNVVDQAVNEGSLIKTGYVGGGTAAMYDVSKQTQQDFRLIILVVVIGIYVVLLIVLGSVINPLRSILTILLSISWTIAITMLVFQYGFGISIMWMVPLILLVVCLGLGMDYDILLTTRVREETLKGKANNDAITQAVVQTGGIITACGIIMAGAFGTMMLSEGWLLREFGFALMFAILLDATVVRIYLVPAIMSLLGKWNWWAPGRLQRTKPVKVIQEHQENSEERKG